MSPDIPDGLADIRRAWSFRDVLEGHLALDALEASREAMQPKGEG
jgi:hypothetical protein